MPLCAPSSAVIRRAVDLLTAAGFRVNAMQGPQRIDRDEYEVTSAELADRQKRRAADTVVITGHHGVYGRVMLKSEAHIGAIRVAADV